MAIRIYKYNAIAEFLSVTNNMASGYLNAKGCNVSLCEYCSSNSIVCVIFHVILTNPFPTYFQCLIIRFEESYSIQQENQIFYRIYRIILYLPL